MIDSYPLSWPSAWPRTPASSRKTGRFARRERVFDGSSARRITDLSIAEGTRRVLRELGLFGMRNVIVSTNVESRRDGLPRSDRRAPVDPGVAVYWTDPSGKQQQVMAIDIYDTVAANLAAVAATIDAMRAIERHGGAQVLNRAFSGFKALPSVTTPTFSVDQAAEAIARRINQNGYAGSLTAAAILRDAVSAKSAIRAALAKTRPDVAGGSANEFQVVQECKRILQAFHGADL